MNQFRNLLFGLLKFCKYRLFPFIFRRETVNVPDYIILDAFNAVKPEPLTDNVPVVRSEAFKAVKPEP